MSVLVGDGGDGGDGSGLPFAPLLICLQINYHVILV